MLSDLPQPDAEALAHSARLADDIRERIAAAGGWLSFADYMDAALYAPALGYYSAGSRKLGARGDFVTAPEISPVFSQCVAGQCAEVLRSLGGGVILEPGAGSGAMAAEMLAELARLEMLPQAYLILETSADLRERQRATLRERVPELIDCVRWLDSQPEQPVRGVIVANEVMDALPAERFRWSDGQLLELGVAATEDGFVEASRPAGDALVRAVSALPGRSEWPDGYTSEVCLRLPAWIRSLNDWLEEGAALLFDYGYTEAEFYHPERRDGTLRCYYRHRAHDDPYWYPGLQDLTVWVNFSQVAQAAQETGFMIAGYTSQAAFLLAADIEQRVSGMAELAPAEQARLAKGLRQLMLPGEMGETVKVIALTKGDVDAPSAMSGRDMRAAL